MELELTWEAYNSLSKEKKKLLEDLGLPAPKAPKKKFDDTLKPYKGKPEHRPICPEPYYLKLTKVCGCCGTTVKLEGLMAHKKMHHSYLSFDTTVEIPADEIFKTQRITSLTCEHCEAVLMTKEKHELVHLIKMLNERS